MRLVYISVVLFLCLVIEIQSKRTHSGVCNGCQPYDGFTRIKRAKYYSSPPQRFYKPPPMTYPIRGPFSYTPPPGYMMDDDEQHQPPNFRPKVSKRPTNEGLGEEDINNIVKYLSKHDLDKIIEFANEKDREPQKYNKEIQFDKPNNINNPDSKNYESRIVNKGIQPETYSEQKFSLNGPYINTQEDFQPYSIDYSNLNENNYQNSKRSTHTKQEPSALFFNKNNLQTNTPFESDEIMQNHQYSFPKTNIQAMTNFNTSDGNIFTDSSIMQEEELPKPTNLREEDHAISYTNNVQTVVKPDSFTYKVENFGALPLMNYHSKLDTVDSYKVPHYTVTSSEKHSALASISNPNIPIEPAPPASVAQEQSDAHLKAIKIWTHRSKGSAYTLHDDGTLSPERPIRPKNFGHL